MAHWTPCGFIGQMCTVTGAHVPPPPGMPSPVVCGDKATVRERLRDGIAHLQLACVMTALKYPFSVPETVEFF